MMTNQTYLGQMQEKSTRAHRQSSARPAKTLVLRKARMLRGHRIRSRIVAGHGPHTHWHLWMALHTLARRVLSKRSAATAGVALRIARASYHRNQRLLLFATV